MRPHAPTVAVAALCLAALGFFAFAAQWLVDPVGMAKALGITLAGGDATSDARAVYGGMEAGLGAFLLFCAVGKTRRTTGLAAAAMTMLGLGLARLFGIAADPAGVTGATHQLLATDFLGSALAFAAWWYAS
jgi:hypothetical protein